MTEFMREAMVIRCWVGGKITIERGLYVAGVSGRTGLDMSYWPVLE